MQCSHDGIYINYLYLSRSTFTTNLNVCWADLLNVGVVLATAARPVGVGHHGVPPGLAYIHTHTDTPKLSRNVAKEN